MLEPPGITFKENDMIRVYIAGPLTGLTAEETKANALKTAAYAVHLHLADSNMIPYVPHLWALYDPTSMCLSYEQYLRMDLAWLCDCDLLIRLPGNSLGGSIEEIVAELVGIPVYAETDCYNPHIIDIRTCLEEVNDVHS